MTTTTLASRSATPFLSTSKPNAIPVAYLQPVLAAYNAANLASCYLERGNIAAARRKLVQALASVNQVSQGGAA